MTRNCKGWNQARRERSKEGYDTPGPETFWGLVVAQKYEVLYTKMGHIKKQNSNIFTPGGLTKMSSPGPLLPLDVFEWKYILVDEQNE